MIQSVMHRSGGVLAAAAVALGLILAAGGSSTARADTPNPGVKEAREKVKEARKEVREERHDLREAVRSGNGGAIREERKDLKEAREKLKASREERRLVARKALEAKLGDLWGKPAVRAELRIHARRLARLHQIERVAKAEGKEAVVKRVDVALAKENARFTARMDALKAKGGEVAK